VPTNTISIELFTPGTKVHLSGNHEAAAPWMIIAVLVRVLQFSRGPKPQLQMRGELSPFDLTLSGHCEGRDAEWKIQVPQKKAFSTKKVE
jgi:hypothetical protein